MTSYKQLLQPTEKHQLLFVGSHNVTMSVVLVLVCLFIILTEITLVKQVFMKLNRRLFTQFILICVALKLF